MMCDSDTECLKSDEHRCDTCKYEKEPWFIRCADCFDYELWKDSMQVLRTDMREGESGHVGG